MKHDLLKTASFALVHFTVAFAVGYAVTGSAAIAVGLGLLEPLMNTVAFFFHERLWARLEGTSPPASSRTTRHACPPFMRSAPQS